MKNFALLAAIDELGNLREEKGISKYYKPKYHVSNTAIKNTNPKKIDIYENIERTSAPYFLRIQSVLETGEVLYKQATFEEIQKLTKDENPFIRRKTSYKMIHDRPESQDEIPEMQWNYSFHPESIFIRYAGLSLTRSQFLFPFARRSRCTHTFGCFE